MVRKITDRVYCNFVNDKDITLFEGQYKLSKGMAYNSYIITDEKTAVLDTIEKSHTSEWLDGIKTVLEGKSPDYLVIHHMEPDHSASIGAFFKEYPQTTLVANAKTVSMISQFFPDTVVADTCVMTDGGKLCLGKSTLNFVFTPMVHWPEVMMSYEESEGVMFSADAFGTFGTSDADQIWDDEARRYYIGIVGKYGAQVQNALKKLSALEISVICPLHGPVITGNFAHYIQLYDKWSSYTPEKNGVCICCASVYGNTLEAAKLLKTELEKSGTEAVLFDLTTDDIHEAVANAFKYDTLVLASTTYNGAVFPAADSFIRKLAERNFKNRKVAFIENGSWAPVAAKIMKAAFDEMKGITYAETTVTVRSALSQESRQSVSELAKELSVR